MSWAGEGLGSVSGFGGRSGWEPRRGRPVHRSWPHPGGVGTQ